MAEFRIIIRTNEPGENIADSLVVSPSSGNVMYFGSRVAAEAVAARQPVRPFVTYVVEAL